MPVAFITHPSCLLHEMGPYHPECPDRLMAVGDRMISAGHRSLPAALYGARRRRASRSPACTAAATSTAIEAASPDEGLHYIDPDTALNPHSLTAAQHAAGAVVLGVDLVMRDECRTAFCAVRPPGHHAERRRAMGFCIFNSVAIGAAHALAAHGLSRVCVVDFDVHHGNGTEDIFQGDPRVLMVGTFQHPLYPYSGFEDPAPNMINVPLPPAPAATRFARRCATSGCPALERLRARARSSSPRASTRIARIRSPASRSPRPTMRG